MIVALALAGLLLGFGKAGIAGTFGPIVTVLLVLAMPADDALGVLLPMLIFADVFSVAAYWRKWETRLLPPLIASSVVGVVAGTALLSIVSEEWLQRIIGVAMLVFVAMYFVTNGIRLAAHHQKAWALGAGSAAGFTSTLAHSGGPPIVLYLMTVGLEPRRFVGTTVAFFAMINLIKIPGYLVAGVFDGELIVDSLWSWVMVPVGVFLGRLLVTRINRAVFERVMLAMLAVGAVILLAT